MSHSSALARLESDLRMEGRAKGTLQQYVASRIGPHGGPRAWAALYIAARATARFNPDLKADHDWLPMGTAA